MLTVKKSSHWHVGKSNHMQFWWLRMSDWFFPLLGTPKSVEPKDKGHEWGNGLIAGPSKSLWGDHLKKTEWWYLMANGTGHLQRSEVNSARPQGNSEQNVPRTKCWLGCRQHEHSATVAESINWCSHFGKPFGGAYGGGIHIPMTQQLHSKACAPEWLLPTCTLRHGQEHPEQPYWQQWKNSKHPKWLSIIE